MVRALFFAAALVVAPSLPHEVAVVRLNTTDAASVAQDLHAIFRGATVVSVGQSRLIVIGDAQTIQEVTEFVRPLCP